MWHGNNPLELPDIEGEALLSKECLVVLKGKEHPFWVVAKLHVHFEPTGEALPVWIPSINPSVPLPIQGTQQWIYIEDIPTLSVIDLGSITIKDLVSASPEMVDTLKRLCGMIQQLR